jgi:hypothetical protein
MKYTRFHQLQIFIVNAHEISTQIHIWELQAKEKEQDPNPIEHPTKMDFMTIVVVNAHPIHNIYTYH